jgi:hypothetical protein
MKKITFPVAAFALMIAAAPALAAQDPQPPAGRPGGAPGAQPPAAQEPAARAMNASGELVKVDTDANTISIKGAGGAEQLFSYNDQTEVTGGREGVAGLATKAGSRVTIEYKDEAGSKLATKIQVEERGAPKP